MEDHIDSEAEQSAAETKKDRFYPIDSSGLVPATCVPLYGLHEEYPPCRPGSYREGCSLN